MRSPSRSQARTLISAGPRHPAANVGDAQATFPVFLDFGAHRRDLRVDDRDGLGRRLVDVVDDRGSPRTAAGFRGPAARPARRRDTRPSSRSCRRSASGRWDCGFRRDRAREPSGAARDAPSARLSGSTYPPNYTFQVVTTLDLHPHDESHSYRFCPRCGSPLERRLLKANEPERLVCGACGFVFYLDPKIAVGTIIRSAADRICAGAACDRSRIRQVGVPGRVCRSRRNPANRRRAGGAGGMRARGPAGGPGQHLLVRRQGAGDRGLRGHGHRRRALHRRRVPRNG